MFTGGTIWVLAHGHIVHLVLGRRGEAHTKSTALLPLHFGEKGKFSMAHMAWGFLK